MVAFTAPFCTRSDPGEDDVFRSSVNPLIARRTLSEHYGVQSRKDFFSSTRPIAALEI